MIMRAFRCLVDLQRMQGWSEGWVTRHQDCLGARCRSLLAARRPRLRVQLKGFLGHELEGLSLEHVAIGHVRTNVSVENNKKNKSFEDCQNSRDQTVYRCMKTKKQARRRGPSCSARTLLGVSFSPNLASRCRCRKAHPRQADCSEAHPRHKADWSSGSTSTPNSATLARVALASLGSAHV